MKKQIMLAIMLVLISSLSVFADGETGQSTFFMDSILIALGLK